ncbi:50S ribosomal protein L30 [SAR202 cluster bacterium AC-409-J13_OGT_754m]|nr:50S ribosomal protein L30 [SAR202 cluster bacterium AC-409-J13_OGT_754m]
MSTLKITWKRSAIGRAKNQSRIIRSLGLTRLNRSVVHYDSPTIRGMVNKVIHMLEVEEIPEEGSPKNVERKNNKS